MLNIHFSYLTSEQQGGLDKFNRAFKKALRSIQTDSLSKVTFSSVYEDQPNTHDTDNHSNKYHYLVAQLFRLWRYDVLVLGHLNLAIVGILFKWLFPSRKLIITTHGIDIWDSITPMKRKVISRADIVLTVSEHSKSRLRDIYNLPNNKIVLLHNTLDDNFRVPTALKPHKSIQQRYNPDLRPMALTIARLSSHEQYKGYDKVILCIPELLKTIPNFLYIIGGSYDETEAERISQLIPSDLFEKHVLLTGYIPETDLTDLYLLADVFIMPSLHEGFGIVFIEAMACGTPTIAGNRDGSQDALVNGELGQLIDPLSNEEILTSLAQTFTHPETSASRLQRQNKTLSYFKYENFESTVHSTLKLLFRGL